jgi:hypothetical protein
LSLCRLAAKKNQAISPPNHSLPSINIAGRRIQPHSDERAPTANNSPQARDPRQRPTDRVTPHILIVRKVSDRNLTLLVDAGQEGALVVDLESEDAVLVGRGECRGESGCVG